MQGGAYEYAPTALATHEDQASAGAPSAPTTLLHTCDVQHFAPARGERVAA